MPQDLVPIREFAIPGQWGANARTIIPPVPLDGVAYRSDGATKADFENGQGFNAIHPSALHNQKDFAVSGVALAAEQFGFIPWSPKTQYIGDASSALGSDGIPYRCIRSNGPDVKGLEIEVDEVTGEVTETNRIIDIGPRDPCRTVGYWISYKQWLGVQGGGTVGEVGTPPDISEIQTDLPTMMTNNQQKTFKIWGAKTADGAAVVYDIEVLSKPEASSLVFSQTSYIENEQNVNLTTVVPPTGSGTVMIAITAKSAHGAAAEPVVKEIQLMSATSWLLTSSGTWKAPVTGTYDIYVVGGSGDGGVAAGPGGAVKYSNIAIAEGASCTVNVGAKGTSNYGGGGSRIIANGTTYGAGGGGAGKQDTSYGTGCVYGGGGGRTYASGGAFSQTTKFFDGSGNGAYWWTSGAGGGTGAGAGKQATYGLGKAIFGIAAADRVARNPGVGNNASGAVTLSFPGKGSYGNVGYQGCIYIEFKSAS